MSSNPVIPALAEAAANFDRGDTPLSSPSPVATIITSDPVPDAVGPSYQALATPATQPAPPGWRTVDISTREWAGDAASLSEPGREGATVPRPLADYVAQQKSLGAAQAAAGLEFTDYLPKLRDASKIGRDALAQGEAERAEAKRVGITGRQLEALDAVQAAPIARTKEAIRGAVQKVADIALGKLAAAEQETIKALEDGAGVRPDEQDYAAASELSKTLDLMPPSIAVPLLRARLVENPARTGKNLGLVAAAIPLLRARIESDKKWNASEEAHGLIQQCEVVIRNAAWYKAHMRLSRVHELQWKVQSFTEDYARHYGDERAGGFLAARDRKFYGDLGVGA